MQVQLTMKSVPTNIGRCRISASSEHRSWAAAVLAWTPWTLCQLGMKAINQILHETDQLAFPRPTLPEHQENFLRRRLTQATRIKHAIEVFHNTLNKLYLLALKRNRVFGPRGILM